ncbi:Fc.00g096600.m01.CDS01 [Cosmosporella sp. VM-42]
MISGTSLARLALLSAVAIGSSVLAPGGKSTFVYDAPSLREIGARNTLDRRIWLEKDGSPISLGYDVPLWPDGKNKRIINFVVEIPRWTDGRIETKCSEPMNLVRGKVDSNKINYNQTSTKGIQKSYVRSQDATEAFDIPAESSILPAAEKPEKYDKWYYLDADYKLMELPE